VSPSFAEASAATTGTASGVFGSSLATVKLRAPPPPRCVDGKLFKQFHATLTATLALPRESIHAVLRAFELTDRAAVVNLRNRYVSPVQPHYYVSS
jgi:hypothetical protein